MPRGRGGGGRKLSQIRAEDNDEDTEDPSRGSAGAKDTKPAAASAAQAAADAAAIVQDDGTKIAEQPLSELERDQVRRYRELQRFLRGSPFYVRPPRQSEHADLARYSDQYHNTEESAGPRLAEYVARSSFTKCRAFPAELLSRHAKRMRLLHEKEAKLARLAQGRFDAAEAAAAAGNESDEDEEAADGPAVASEESDDENEYTKIHGDMEGEDSDGSGSDGEAAAGGL